MKADVLIVGGAPSAAAAAMLRKQILAKVSLPEKELPDSLLYSEQGSRYFEDVTQTPGYYLARTEMAIMETHVDDIAACIGPNALLVEYGSGSSRKTRLLLDALPRLAGYVPIDISKDFLLAAARQLTIDYPHLEILPVCADYEQTFEAPVPQKPFVRRVAYFPGSTIGNRTHPDARRFLAKTREDMGSGAGLLIGVDLTKDPDLLAAAYNVREQACCSFVLSTLENLNQNYQSDFDLNQFRFQFIYNDEKTWVEIRLRSLCNQTVCVCGQPVAFTEGESVLIQVACKYTIPEFSALAGEAGWRVKRVWTDPRQFFSVQYLECQ